MLTVEQRLRLAEFQIEKLHWFFEPDFNFGPIICRENFSRAAVTRKNWRDFLRVEPRPNAPPPITVSQSWASVPELFKEQFLLAYSSNAEFGEVNARLDELGNLLRIAAIKLAAGEPLTEIHSIANSLLDFGSELHQLAEFSKVFKIPKRCYSEKRLNQLLDEIRESFQAARLLVPTKRYDTHASYQGTSEDWRWFLEAERLGLDIHKSADAYKLAEIYSEDLRQRTMSGKAPRRAKGHGFSGTKVPSLVLKNRRSIVKRHVLTIKEWIRAAYTRHTSDPGMPPS
jgi:hypothetical protein